MTATPQTGPLAWKRTSEAGLRLRTAEAGDKAFLLEVYMLGRIDELAGTAWTDEQKSHFLFTQAQAQDADYSRNYPHSQRRVIERNGRPVGRLYVDRRGTANHVLDIALLPEARGRGWGGAVLADLIDEAAAEGRAVTIYVESFNPAKRLYERLGFQQAQEHAPYLLMRRDPAG